MKSHDQKFVVRAPPRRRVKGEEPDDQPLFLRKAFTMISSCPPEIGGWSEKGDTVIVRDVKQFSEKVIPTAYKHNNFSSFVRQLNFYGFRKVKSESMEHADWWEFRHPQFLRDEPALLSEIKRSVHFTDPGSGQEVSELRLQVTGLTDRIAAMHEQIDRLTGLVTNMQLSSAPATAPSSSSSSSEAQKKRKLVVKGSGASSLGPIPLQRMMSTDSTMMIGEYEAAGADLPSGPDLLNFSEGQDFFGARSGGGALERVNSLVPGWTEEGEEMDMLFTEAADLLMEEDIITTPSAAELPQASEVTPISASATPTAAAIEAVSSAAKDISSVLDSLSPELRLRFVDKLAESMGAQLTQGIAQQVQVQVHVGPSSQPEKAQPVSYTPAIHVPVSAPIYPTSYPASSDPAQFRLPSGSKAPEIALPLASAAIAALLSSMQTFAHNPQMLAAPSSRGVAHHMPVIKEEVACK